MKNNPLLFIGLIAVLVAVVTVIALRYLGHDNPTVVGGGVAGGVAGAISANLMKKKE